MSAEMSNEPASKRPRRPPPKLGDFVGVTSIAQVIEIPANAIDMPPATFEDEEQVRTQETGQHSEITQSDENVQAIETVHTIQAAPTDDGITLQDFTVQRTVQIEAAKHQPKSMTTIVVETVPHQETVENAKYQCSLCWKNYNNPQGLRTHLRNHDPNEQVECSICKKVFRTSRHLRSHMNVHSAEKTYQCGRCPKAFIRKSDYTRHMIRHSDTRPYKCDTCGSRFNEITTLKRHKDTHMNMSYPCPFCETISRRPYAFRAHLLRLHSDRVKTATIRPDRSVQFTTDEQECEVGGENADISQTSEDILDPQNNTTLVTNKSDNVQVIIAQPDVDGSAVSLPQISRKRGKKHRQSEPVTVHPDGLVTKFTANQNQELLLTENADVFCSENITEPELTESYYEWMKKLSTLVSGVRPPLNPRIITVVATVEQTVKELLINPTEFSLSAENYNMLLSMRERFLSVLNKHFHKTLEKLQ